MTAAAESLALGEVQHNYGGVNASMVLKRPSMVRYLANAGTRARHDAMADDLGGFRAGQLREINQEIRRYADRNAARVKSLEKARADAITNGYTSAQLRYIEAEISKYEFPPLYYREIFGACIVGVPEGYKDYLWRMTKSVGEAQPITNPADDVPSVDSFLAEYHQRFQAYGIGYGYSAFDQASEAAGQMALTVEKGTECVDRMERKFESIAKDGDSSFQLKGFFNYGPPASDPAGGGVPLFGTTTGYDVSAYNWKALARGTDANKTTLISAWTDFLRVIVDESENVERGPFVVCMDMELWFLLANTPRSSVDGTTLMSVFRQNPLCKDIVFWPDLKTAGVSSASRVVAFTRDPRKFKYLEVVTFKSMPPRERGAFGWVVSNYGVSGGVIMQRPRGMAYLDLTG